MPLPLPKSKSEIEEIERTRLPLAVERAKKAPFHAERLGDIDTSKLADRDAWRRIPILDKEELRALSAQEFNTRFNMAPREEVHEYWRSGGSTGKPLFYPRTFADMPYMYLGFTRGIDIAGVGKGDTVHVSFPLGIHPVGHMYARVCQRSGAGVNWAGSGASTPSAAQVQLIEDLQPTIWMGMSSYGLHLANHAEAMDIDLAGSSVRRVITSAEPLSAAKRAKIERSWGAEVFDTFGMTECCLIGAEDEEHDGFRIWADMFYAEVLDPESLEPVGEGETGTLVVTPMWTSTATPFVRWSTGDIVVNMGYGGGKGPYSVFPRIRHAHRTAGFFKVRGVNINHSEFEDFMFHFEQVQDFKAEVVTTNDLDALRLSIELKRGTDPDAIKADLEAATKRTFEVSPEVVVLKHGALAQEFEGAVKAPRFQDNRA
jgi:phenylacetate-CoA ligase